MFLPKKVLGVFLVFLTVVIVFAVGIFMGIKFNRFFLTILPLDESQHYIFNLAKKYTPDYYAAQITYSGTLIDLTNNSITLLSDETLSDIIIPLNPKLNNFLTYSNKVAGTPIPTDKAAFKPGVKISVVINFGFLTNELYRVSLIIR